MTDQPTYTPPPGDQAQLDALGGYLPLLNNLMEATEAHYEAATFLHHILATGKFDAASRAEAYKAQGATARAMLQAFAAMQQAAAPDFCYNAKCERISRPPPRRTAYAELAPGRFEG
jgi:hypothetical protein